MLQLSPFYFRTPIAHILFNGLALFSSSACHLPPTIPVEDEFIKSPFACCIFNNHHAWNYVFVIKEIATCRRKVTTSCCRNVLLGRKCQFWGWEAAKPSFIKQPQFCLIFPLSFAPWYRRTFFPSKTSSVIFISVIVSARSPCSCYVIGLVVSTFHRGRV